MKPLRVLLITIFMLMGTPLKAYQPPLADPAMEARFQALILELRCMECQNQSLSDSNAPLAQDLRREVRKMMAQGDSDEQIKTFLVARYGDYVLYQPPLKQATVLLWVGPFLLVMLGLGLIIVLVRRRSHRVDKPLTQEEQQQLEQLLKGQNKEADS